jgi:phosphomannomutase
VEDRSLVDQKENETTGALLAGEMSGHIFFKERWFGFDDGIYSAARLLEILSKEKSPPKSCLRPSRTIFLRRKSISM